MTFHGTGPLFLGVELEVDDGKGPLSDLAEDLLELSKGESLFYLKEDSSLNHGLEVVSQPCSVKFHRKEFPWPAITQVIRNSGFSAAPTCGLHIHASRKAFGQGWVAQDLTLSKMVLLFWRCWEELEIFSRRGPDEWSWAKPNHDTVAPPDMIKALPECKGGTSRYRAINTQNEPTIEIRIFHSTLRPYRILAALELVELMVRMCLDTGIGRIYRSTWMDVVKRVKSKVLLKYLEERDLLRG